MKEDGAIRADDMDHKAEEQDERYAKSSRVQDEAHVTQRELKTARSMK